MKKTARKLGLQSTLRSLGKLKKQLTRPVPVSAQTNYAARGKKSLQFRFQIFSLKARGLTGERRSLSSTSIASLFSKKWEKAMRISSILLAGLLLLAVDARVSQADIIENYGRDTSLAFGVFTPPSGFGSPKFLVFSFTTLSSLAENNNSAVDGLTNKPGVVDAIAADSILPDEFEAILNSTYGTLDNYEFIFNTLPEFGRADVQLKDAFQECLAALQANNRGVVFQAPTPSAQFIETKHYELYGGTLPDKPNPGDTTLITLSVNVDYYSGNFMVSVVPEPSSLMLLGLCAGLIGSVAIARRRPVGLRRV